MILVLCCNRIADSFVRIRFATHRDWSRLTHSFNIRVCVLYAVWPEQVRVLWSKSVTIYCLPKNSHSFSYLVISYCGRHKITSIVVTWNWPLPASNYGVIHLRRLRKLQKRNLDFRFQCSLRDRRLQVEQATHQIRRNKKKRRLFVAMKKVGFRRCVIEHVCNRCSKLAVRMVYVCVLYRCGEVDLWSRGSD